MANYPIKMLKDENGTPFVPLVAPGAINDGQGFDLLTELDKKLEKTNIIAGDNVTITTSGNDITINSAAGGASANVIDNLNQETGGVGVLDAHQGYVLKGMIPEVADNLTTVDNTKALSAYQGYLLNHKIVPAGGSAGQVLKKRTNTDNDLEWGDAADPNAIVGDGSIKKIVELTYEEYKALDSVDPDTEYHILDAASSLDQLQETLDDLQDQLDELRENGQILCHQGFDIELINQSNGRYSPRSCTYDPLNLVKSNGIKIPYSGWYSVDFYFRCKSVDTGTDFTGGGTDTLVKIMNNNDVKTQKWNGFPMRGGFNINAKCHFNADEILTFYLQCFPHNVSLSNAFEITSQEFSNFTLTLLRKD